MHAGVLNGMKVGWRRDSVENTGVTFVRKLTKALWYLDTHHAKFSSRSIKLLDHSHDFLCLLFACTPVGLMHGPGFPQSFLFCTYAF